MRAACEHLKKDTFGLRFDEHRAIISTIWREGSETDKGTHRLPGASEGPAVDITIDTRNVCAARPCVLFAVPVANQIIIQVGT